MKVLFITRKFPPSTGGMEQFAYGLTTAYGALETHSQVWSLGGARWHLVWWLPWVALRLAVSRQAEVVHLMDGVLVLLVPIARLFERTVVVTIHGLEVTYPQPVYQRLFFWGVRRVHGIVSVSQATSQLVQQAASEHHLPVGPNGTPCTTITHGTPAPVVTRDQAIQRIENRFSIPSQAQVVLLVGRLVPRKGQVWFLQQVAPLLLQTPGLFVVIVGQGAEQSKVETAVQQLAASGHTGRVLVRGLVSDEELSQWYARANVLVMPNRPIQGDMEGFGMVAMEAQSYGCPVVASRLEGIADAVQDGQHGRLVLPQDPHAFVQAISEVLGWDENHRRTIAQDTLTHHAWRQVAMEYQTFFSACQKYLKSLP